MYIFVCTKFKQQYCISKISSFFLLFTFSFTTEFFGGANTKDEEIFGEIDKNQEFSEEDEEWLNWIRKQRRSFDDFRKHIMFEREMHTELKIK